MVILLTFIFIIILLICFLPVKSSKSEQYIMIGIGIVLFFVASFRGDVDRDYSYYVLLYTDFENLFTFVIEPSFVLIAWFVRSVFDDVRFLFMFYALLGVFIKLKGINQLSEFKLLSILLYFSYSFILQEMTQIRSGVAIGFVFLSIKPLYDRNLKLFLLYTTLASFFHISALICFLLWFISPKKMNIPVYASIILIAYILHFLGIQFSTLMGIIPIKMVQMKFQAYSLDLSSYINVLNMWQLIRVFLCYLFLWKVNVIQLHNKYSIILLKFFIFSTCSLVIFSDLPVLSFRISDIFMIADIVLIPSLIYFFKPDFIVKILVALFGFSYLFLNLYYNQIIS